MNPSASSEQESGETPGSPPESGHKPEQDSGTNGHKEPKRSSRLRAALPMLVKIGKWKTKRPKMYYVRYGEERTLQSFSTERERNDFAAKLKDKRKFFGSAMLTDFNVTEWQEFREWKRRKEEASKSPIVAKAVTDYLALRLREGMKEKSDTYRHIEKHLGRFALSFGDRHLDQVTVEEIRTWLETLKNPKEKDAPMSLVTRRHHRTNLYVFFERAVLEEWVTKNPCARIKPPKIDEEIKEPLTPRQIFSLLSANKDMLVVGRLALELFGGLRYSSAGRLTAEHIDFESQGIALPGQSHKSGAWKYREGHPSVLWAWLKHAESLGDSFKEGSVSNYGRLKALAFAKAQFDNPGNALRDSFASYHLAMYKSYQMTGYLMQHTRVSTTRIYEGKAKTSDAKLVFSMTPEAVASTWEQFLLTHQPK